MFRKTLLLVVVLVLISSTSYAALTVKFHNHTAGHSAARPDCYGSDGSDTIWEMGAKAAEEGFVAFAINDHLDQILAQNPLGIEDYIRLIAEYNKHPKALPIWARSQNGGGRFCNCVPGVEITLGTTSHVLFVASNPNVLRQVAVIASNGQPLAVLAQLADLAERTDSVMIAAHPTHRAVTLKYSYPYVLPLGAINGLEVHNAGVDAVSDPFNLIPRLPSFRPAFFEAGQDDHGAFLSVLNRVLLAPGEGIPTSLLQQDIQKRKTIVLADNVSELTSCLRAGKCYATYGNAQIDSANAMPGGRLDPDVNSSLILRVSGLPILTIKPMAKVIAVEKGTGRVSYGSCLLPVPRAEIIVPLKATLQPQLGNAGWYLYLDVCDQIFVSAIEILPFGGKPPIQPATTPQTTPPPSTQGLEDLLGTWIGLFKGPTCSQKERYDYSLEEGQLICRYLTIVIGPQYDQAKIDRALSTTNDVDLAGLAYSKAVTVESFNPVTGEISIVRRLDGEEQSPTGEEWQSLRGSFRALLKNGVIYIRKAGGDGVFGYGELRKVR